MILTKIENGLVEGVIQHLIPEGNEMARPRYAMDAKYITVHNTGNTSKGADAEMHTKYVDTVKNYVSWHFTVDDKGIYQELPVNESAWHAGDGTNGTGNRQSIAIEICEYEGIDYSQAEKNAIELIVFLMKELSIPLENVVPHKKWSGKYCPHIILDNGWDMFVARIKNTMAKECEERFEDYKDVPLWAKEENIVGQASQMEILKGNNNCIKANKSITRIETLAFIVRAVNYILRKVGK